MSARLPASPVTVQAAGQALYLMDVDAASVAFLTPDQAARLLQVDVKVLREWLGRGVLRARHPGQKWLIPVTALAEFQAGADNTG